MKRVLLAMLAMFFITASAYAAENDVHPFTDNPVIAKGTCSQAGTLTLTFEDKTEFKPGLTEIIGRLSPTVTICQPINLYAVIADGSQNDKKDGVFQGTFTAADDVVMHIQGKVGEDTITITPLRGTLTAGAYVPGMKFVLFDNLNDDFELIDASKVVWKESTPNANDWDFYNASKTTQKLAVYPAEADNKYVRASTLLNSLCVLAPTDYPNHEVKIYLESSPKVYTFAPADSVIAIVGAKQAITLVPEKRALTAKLGSDTDQSGEGTVADCYKCYETAYGMCENYDYGYYGHFAFSSGVDFPTGDYEVEIEILVNGASGDHGAYFAGGFQGFRFDEKRSALTDAFDQYIFEKQEFANYLADGKKTTATPSEACSDRKKNQNITKMVVAARVVPGDVKGKKFLRVNVPCIVVPGVTTGDKIGLNVVVRQGRCKVLVDGSRTLFTMVENCKEVSETGKLLFPYFAGTDSGYWNGIALTNPGVQAVAATLNIYEVNDAGVNVNVGSVKVNIPAQGMFVDLVNNLPTLSGFTGSLAGGRCYIEVETDASLAGFAMMGDGTQSMGYVVD